MSKQATNGDAEIVANALNNMKQVLRHMNSSSSSSSTDNKAQQPARLARLRAEFAKSANIIEGVRSTLGPESKKSFATLQQEFARAERAAAAAVASDAANSAPSWCAAESKTGVAQQQQLVGKITPHALDTELHLQREKQKDVLEIEQLAGEVRGMMTDARDLISSQSDGIATIGANVGASRTSVAAGVEELKKARKMQ